MSRTEPQEAGTVPVSAVNDVRLRGRMAAEPVTRALPSGTEIVGFRVVIERASTQMTRGSQQRSDWVECTAWTASLRTRVRQWRRGDIVEVEGALRRRFRRGAGAGSVVDIEVLGGRLVQRAPVAPDVPAPATPARAPIDEVGS